MNKAYQISISRRIQRPAAEVFEIVEDLERFPEFMPNVTSIRVIESSQDKKVAEWETVIDETPLTWTEEGIYDRDNYVVRFRAVEGVFDRFDGHWEVVPDGNNSRVTLELDYEIGLPEIEELISPILRERLLENAESMLRALEERTKTES